MVSVVVTVDRLCSIVLLHCCNAFVSSSMAVAAGVDSSTLDLITIAAMQQPSN